MLTDHYRLSCDEPGCKAFVMSQPLDFGGSEPALRRFYASASRLGWTRLELEPDRGGKAWTAAHYCPKHRGLEGVTLIF